MAQPSTSAAFLKDLEDCRASLVSNRYGNTSLYIKGLVLAAAFVVCWSTLVFFLPEHSLLAIAPGMALGFVIALLGFNVFHDVGHGSFFRTPRMNKRMHWPLGVFLGASILVWNPQHNLHHRHPNSETDTDIDVPGVRMHPGQPWKWYHRFQAFYAPLIYSLGYFAWIWRDLRRSMANRVGTVEIGMKPRDKVELWIQKVLYIGLVITPIVVVNGAAAIVPLVAMYLTAGIVLAIVFQCAHVVEVSEFPNAERMGEIDNAEHQLRTTVDFSTGNNLSSRVFRWFVGGLNFQVLHHLRPDISHVHYAKLHGPVQKLTAKYGLPYRQMSYLQALWSHLTTLYRNGRKPSVLAV